VPTERVPLALQQQPTGGFKQRDFPDKHGTTEQARMRRAERVEIG